MLDYNQDQVPTTPVPTVAPATENTVSVEQVAATTPKRKWWLYALLVFILVLLGSGGWWYYAKGQVMLLAKNMTWKSGGNYKMSQTLNVDLSDIVTPASEKGTINLIDFKKASVKLDGAVDVVGDKLEGQTNLVFGGDDKEIKFSLKYKKIDKTVYLSVDSQDDWVKEIPFDLTSTWISIDQASLQANPLLQGKPNDYMPNFKDWSQKNNAFLQNVKDKKLIILSDPHQTKEVGGIKLKKMDFNINADKINEFLLVSIDAFAEPSAAIEMKKNFETYKTSDPEAWTNMQEFIKATTFSFWVDPKTKSILGMDFSINNFDLKDKNEHVLNLTVNFSQTIENIESKEIVAPEKVVTLDELQSMLFSGFSQGVESKESVSMTTIFTVEQLTQLQADIETCFQAKKRLNIPGENEKVCDGVENVMTWPILSQGYQWSKSIMSSKDLGTFEFCVYTQDITGVTCSQTGCFKKACQENFDSDKDNLSDKNELKYGTDENDSDSDNDGYLDGDEVKNGYNPLGAGKL